MDDYWLWVVAGITLVIVEMLSGTFYLLVLGIAALGAAAVAYAGGSFWMQVVSAVAVTIAGVILVHRRRSGRRTASAQSLDVGEPVTLESWISEADGLARVSYRNAVWEAQVEGERPADARIFHIHAMQGNRLLVSARRPGRVS